MDKGYFLSNPDRIRATYKTIGMIIIFGSLFVLPSLLPKIIIFALSGLLWLFALQRNTCPGKPEKG